MLADRMRMAASNARAPGVITWADNPSSSANTTTITMNSVSFSTAASDRLIVIAGSGMSATQKITSATIGGVSATLVLDQTGTTIFGGIWQALVPSGTSGTVVTNWSGAPGTRVGLGVWALYNISPTVYDTGGSGASPGTDTLNIPANGVALGWAGADLGPNTWTGLTERFDSTVVSGYMQTGASDAFTAVQTGRTITNTFTGGTGNRVMMCASWGPP